MSAEKMILQYLRDPHTNVRKGVVVAVANETGWVAGVSVANVKAGDVFDAGLGLKMAHGRALKAIQRAAEMKAAQEKMLAEHKALLEGTEHSPEEAELHFPEVSDLVDVPVNVWPEVQEFLKRAQRYFKDKKSICTYEASAMKKNFEEQVAKLTNLFDTLEEKNRQFETPPSLRGVIEQPITASEVIALQQLVAGINELSGTMHKGVGPQNKTVTRVKT